MSDVRIVSPRETVIEVDAHAVPGRPGVVTPELRVLHDGAVDAAGAAASSASSAATSASNAASSASAAQDARTGAVAAASAADDAMQAASGAASDADQSRVGAAASALAASVAEQAAVAAQEGLVAAREAAAGSASSAATSASEAVSSASSAATAQTGAEAARGAAEGFAEDAVTARNEAVTAKTLAEGFAGEAETARDATLIAAAALKDTGWRALTGFLLEELVTSQVAAIRRVGDRVTVEGYFALSRALTGVMVPLTTALPYGFRPRTRYASIGSLVGAAFNVPVHIRETYAINAVGGEASSLPVGVNIYFAFSWITSQPLPTTLPGTPA